MGTNRKLLIGTLLTALVLLPTAFAQEQHSADATTIAEITQLEQDYVKADLANDPSFLKEHSADDYTAGSSWGNWDTKDSILKDMGDSKANRTNSEEMTNLKVRSYGNTAIATYNEKYDSMYHGKHRARTTMCTDTWVKDSSWKLVAGHCSELAKSK
jgi:ketosteroid isomerase-like protein